MTIAGYETYLLSDDPGGDPGIVVNQVGSAEVAPAAAEQLAARLTHLASVVRASEESVVKTARTTVEHAPSRLNIEGFFRVGADGRSTSFDTFRDPNVLMRQLRSDQGVCGKSDASPVVILTEPDDRPGEHQGTVVLAFDDRHLPTIDRAIRCLEAVRAGLLEAGHADY